MPWGAGATQHNGPGSVLFETIRFEPNGLFFCFEKVQSTKEKVLTAKKIQTFLAGE